LIDLARDTVEEEEEEEEKTTLAGNCGKDSARKFGTMAPSSRYKCHRILPLVGSVLTLFLAQSLLASVGCWTNGVDAFAIPTATNNGCRNIWHNHAYRNPLLASASASAGLESNTETYSEKKQLVLVLGGSGYIGRRVCKELVEASSGDDEAATRVVSISRNGKPPSWCFDDNGDSSSVWAENVEWIKHDIGSALGKEGVEESLAEILGSIFQATTTNESNENEASPSPWETTIVGCIGNVNPTPAWEGLWGLAFDDNRLFEENGKVYDLFLNETNSLRERDNNLLNLQRCVFLSIDYTCQKCLEGPIEGYVDGKRLAERRFLEAVSNGSDESSSDDPSNLEKVVVIGLPNFVFGGKRFPGFGKFYRKLVESLPAKAYKGGNQALRSLSVAAPEDWVEEMVRITF
jgi:hypothetical protein